jgi:hypothetical protein
MVIKQWLKLPFQLLFHFLDNGSNLNYVLCIHDDDVKKAFVLSKNLSLIGF